MKQGENGRGTTDWTGMKPPEGAPAHDYHFQIFALDTMPEIPHGASRAEVLDALRGHVLAGSEITGHYRRPE